MTAVLLCLPSWMRFMQMHRIQNNSKRKRNLNILISFDHSFFYKLLSLNTLTGFTDDCSIQTAAGISMKICEEFTNSFKVTIRLCHSNF